MSIPPASGKPFEVQLPLAIIGGGAAGDIGKMRKRDAT